MRRRLLGLTMAVSALLLFPSSVAGLGTLDQSQTATESLVSVGGSPGPPAAQAQTFTAGLSGLLDTVVLMPQAVDLNGHTFSIRTVASGLPTTTVLASYTFSTTTPALGPWIEISFAAPASVTAGTQYAIVVEAPPAGTITMGQITMMGTSIVDYVGGEWLIVTGFGAGWERTGAYDMAFQTYVTLPSLADTAMVVPSPAPPVAILSYGLALLVALGALATVNVRSRAR